MLKKLLIGCAAFVLLVVLIVPRILNKSQFADPVADPIVEVTSVESRTIELFTSLVGSVEPEGVVYVYPKAAGEVTAVTIKAGEYVQAGQVICEIDTKQIESAKSSLDAAELSLRQAKENLSRQSVLYSSGGISEQEYRQYSDNVTSAQISYDSAKVNYDNQVSYSQITAPISGTVEVSNFEVFDQVSQNDLLCVISDEGAKVVSFSATERIKNVLSEGGSISVEKDGAEYEGIIYEVSSMADSSTGLFKVKARLSNGGSESNLPTGSMVKLSLVSESVAQAQTIPVDSVYYDGGISYVYTYDSENSTLHKIEVEVGLYDSEWIEVISGLDHNTQVLTTWSSELYEGTVVRIKGTEIQDANQNNGTEPQQS